MRISTALAIGLLGTSLTACTAILQPLRDNTAPPGLVSADGTVNPCHGYERDHQACGNAISNARHINQIKVGLSRDEVRAIMRHDPEERTAHTDGGTVTETWGYLIDYRGQRTTIVVFTNGRVSGIEQRTSSRPDDVDDTPSAL
jgi:hypothetical protein